MDNFTNANSQKSLLIKTILPSLALIIIAFTLTFVNPSYLVQAQFDSKTGIFNHTQTDSSGSPEWVNTGNWSLTSMNSSSPTFNAIIDMVKPDGSAAHEHEINEFKLISSQISEDDTTILNGTSTITMREGPVTDEPTIINLSEESISLFFEPSKIDNHFGNQSITGSETK